MHYDVCFILFYFLFAFIFFNLALFRFYFELGRIAMLIWTYADILGRMKKYHACMALLLRLFRPSNTAHALSMHMCRRKYQANPARSSRGYSITPYFPSPNPPSCCSWAAAAVYFHRFPLSSHEQCYPISAYPSVLPLHGYFPSLQTSA
jgi:hypothetical protein